MNISIKKWNTKSPLGAAMTIKSNLLAGRSPLTSASGRLSLWRQRGCPRHFPDSLVFEVVFFLHMFWFFMVVLPWVQVKMPHCMAVGCANNTKKKTDGVVLHVFPKQRAFYPLNCDRLHAQPVIRRVRIRSVGKSFAATAVQSTSDTNAADVTSCLRVIGARKRGFNNIMARPMQNKREKLPPFPGFTYKPCGNMQNEN